MPHGRKTIETKTIKVDKVNAEVPEGLCALNTQYFKLILDRKYEWGHETYIIDISNRIFGRQKFMSERMTETEARKEMDEIYNRIQKGNYTIIVPSENIKFALIGTTE